MIFEPADQQRHSAAEQHVGDDCAGDRGLHEHVLPGMQGRERDAELGQVSQSRVEQAADRVAGSHRDRFGRVAQQGGQRHDRQGGQHKQECVRLGPDELRDQDHRDERQQPQERAGADRFQERSHDTSRRRAGVR
jgi:hypothetical protein